ncbi:HpcH/HpaI aldolase/citrate lyase family protein [Nocardioides pocheonensis]|uniref:CoA ester lyase n=1 Tax=Nocardioides pocheonensis TaxID=661485 RepID=A0A3N0GJM1_9ACTN|nr:CoA ester lyase [Nocardioides pocheonensis]RNM12639.1 CoA ester lyase [Nocardioides pocheonensis]
MTPTGEAGGDLSWATTFLFVPGARPDRFARAAASGADVVVLDLEDGVAPSERTFARQEVAAWLAAGNDAVVRISATGTEDQVADLAALGGTSPAVMLAKAESAADVEAVTATLGPGTEVVALVESARGLLGAGAIAAAPGVRRMALGNVDLASALGVDPNDRTTLLAARSMLVLASSAAGLTGPVDGVTTMIDDVELIRSDADHAASLGFRGKLCIHPRQVAAAAQGFAPTAAQVAWAERVVETGAQGGARAVDGAMVDRPVEVRARDILCRAQRRPVN